MQKHLVNIRLFHSKLADIARKFPKPNFQVSIEIRDYSHDPTLKERYYFGAYIAGPGHTSSEISMEDCLKQMKARVKAFVPPAPPADTTEVDYEELPI